ncbi:MAG TPA: hypothetical protein VMU32_12855 [Solirubrobacteraceae bacterium]|nr:hypothetical protein [Solirubrobacteraceae bacterium]
MSTPRRIALTLSLGAVLLGGIAPAAVAAATAGAGGNLVQEAEQAGQEEATKTTTTTATTGSETSGGSGVNFTLIIGLAAAIVLLGGIAFVIVRDARSVAPVAEGPPTPGSRNPEARLRKRRAQAKAARRQRRRNR